MSAPAASPRSCITVREVMVALPDIFSLPSDLMLDEAMAKVVEGQHSRIPIYDPQRGPEHIVGVLYYKDLMRWMRIRLSNLGQSSARSRVSWTPSSRTCGWQGLRTSTALATS